MISSTHGQAGRSTLRSSSGDRMDMVLTFSAAAPVARVAAPCVDEPGLYCACRHEGLEITLRDANVLADLVKADATFVDQPADEAHRRAQLGSGVFNGQQGGHPD